MNEEIRSTIEAALEHYRKAKRYPSVPVAQVVERLGGVAAARAWLASQPAQWTPVSDWGMADGNIELETNDDGSQLRMSSWGDAYVFNLPDYLRLCRKEA